MTREIQFRGWIWRAFTRSWDSRRKPAARLSLHSDRARTIDLSFARRRGFSFTLARATMLLESCVQQTPPRLTRGLLPQRLEFLYILGFLQSSLSRQKDCWTTTTLLHLWHRN